MVCIVGVNILNYQYIEIGLMVIFGIGCICLCSICVVVGVDFLKKVKDLIDVDLEKLCEEVGKFVVEGDLCCEVMMNIKCLMDFGCYCGVCYCKGLLMCGQCMCMNVCICKGLCCVV